MSARKLQQALCGTDNTGRQCARSADRDAQDRQLVTDLLLAVGLLASGIGPGSGTGPGLLVSRSGTLVATGFSAVASVLSSRNLFSIVSIDDFAASGPVSRMSLCW